MFGTYRLLLAVLVALSHMEVQVWGCNPGICAVVNFYIISGFVMTALICTHYAQCGDVKLFYFDRT
ncbi:hypothetical protein ACFL2Q_17675 [Thermodesulfobacteriota bacterium]